MAAHAEIIGWAAGLLGQASPATQVVAQTPYSTVIKIDGGHALYYLKQTPPNLFIEAKVIAICRDKCGIRAIPEIIASDPRRNCFLMTSCGDLSLRQRCGGSYEHGKLDIELAGKALRLYRDMQLATMDHICTFIDLGVPDWRLDKMPQLYRDLVDDAAMLQDYNLDQAHIASLRELAGEVERKCKALSAFGIEACLNHSDLHDGNMLFDRATQAVSLIDLGEVTVDHPFLSLVAALGRMSRRYKIDPASRDYKRLYEACFSGWRIAGADLELAVSMAEDLAVLYWVFSHRRLEIAAGRQSLNHLEKMTDRVKNGLLMFIEKATRTPADGCR